MAVVLLARAVGCALWVVFPRLERRVGRPKTEPGLIYFGHLRQRSVDDIDKALAGLDEAAERREIARQLHVTAQVAWKKRAWLQNRWLSWRWACASSRSPLPLSRPLVASERSLAPLIA